MSSPSDEPEWEDAEPDLPQLVVIVDTGMVIEIKVRIAVGDQWDLLDRMLALVEQGRLAFPTKVHRELTDMKFPDAPGAWCGRAVKELQFSDPDDAAMAAVLAVAPNLVEENADNEHEKADPYVVAMAHDLQQTDLYDVVVATTDVVDRLPLKIALATACDRLEIPTWDFDTFVAWVIEATSTPPPAVVDPTPSDEDGLFIDLR